MMSMNSTMFKWVVLVASVFAVLGIASYYSGVGGELLAMTLFGLLLGVTVYGVLALVDRKGMILVRWYLKYKERRK